MVTLKSLLNQLMASDWVVYSKACLNRTESVVRYLTQYSHRIAISDWRILGNEGDHVQFRYKDYRDHNRKKVMSLPGSEFIRRFLLHVLPQGLMRIRHYGFLANRCCKAKLAATRAGIMQKVAVNNSATFSNTAEVKPLAQMEKCRSVPNAGKVICRSLI